MCNAEQWSEWMTRFCKQQYGRLSQYDIKQKMPDLKEHMLYESIYLKFKIRQN